MADPREPDNGGWDEPERAEPGYYDPDPVDEYPDGIDEWGAH